MVETLRAINVIVEADWAKFENDNASLDESLEAQLFSKPTVDALGEILAQRGRSAAINDQFVLALKLITLTARSKKARQALVKAGILDILASKLAAFAHEDLKRTGRFSQSSPILPLIPPQTSPRASLPHLLDAITQIIRGSSYRSMRLIYNKDINALFPAPYYSDARDSTTSVSYLLPKLEAMQGRPARDIQKAFPALSCFDKSSAPVSRGKLDVFSTSSSRYLLSDEVVSPFESWLVHLARTTVAFERLAAVWLLAHLIPAINKVCPELHVDPVSIRSRERSLALLVVPVIVNMIEEATQKTGSSLKQLSLRVQLLFTQSRERAPKALSKLVQDSSALQKAAVDAGAIKVLAQLLKKTFDPFNAARQVMWSPTNLSPGEPAVGKNSEPDPRTLIVSPEAMHAFRTRAAALRAIATLGQKDDSPRRSIIEASIMQYVYESLQPFESGKEPSHEPKANNSLEGNPSDVLVAACKTVTALSRSVSILRTSLIDAKIAKPVFKLLKHPNVKVQLAATAAVTNLVLNFSPMREVSAENKEADGQLKRAARQRSSYHLASPLHHWQFYLVKLVTFGRNS